MLSTPNTPPPALAYTTRGAGPQPILCLHGFLGAGRNVASLARRLQEQQPTWHLVLPDLNGHGNSAATPPQATLFDLARSVHQLVTQLQLPGPLPVVGHSLGGRVALALLQLAPTWISQVICLDIPPGPLPPQTGGVQQVLQVLLRAPAATPSRQAMRQFLLSAGLSPMLTDWLLQNLIPTATGVTWHFDRLWLQALHQRAMQDDLWPIVTHYAPRLHFVLGANSAYVDPTTQHRLTTLGSGVTHLPNAGHFLHVDQPQALVKTLLQLLPQPP